MILREQAFLFSFFFFKLAFGWASASLGGIRYKWFFSLRICIFVRGIRNAILFPANEISLWYELLESSISKSYLFFQSLKLFSYDDWYFFRKKMKLKSDFLLHTFSYHFHCYYFFFVWSLTPVYSYKDKKKCSIVQVLTNYYNQLYLKNFQLNLEPRVYLCI